MVKFQQAASPQQRPWQAKEQKNKKEDAEQMDGSPSNEKNTSRKRKKKSVIKNKTKQTKGNGMKNVPGIG